MITKTLIGLSALISAGWIVGTDPVSRPAEAAAKFVERFPSFEDLMLQPTELKQIAVLPASTQPASTQPAHPAASVASAASAPKADKQAVSRPAGCESQTWPYIASSCLTSIDGSPVRRPARTITIERKLGNGSIIVQAELAEMVTR
jgi:hypothetical protein